MARCPNCWSGVESLDGDCPHCGLPLVPAARARRGRRWAAAVAGLALVAILLVVFGGDRPGDSSGDGTAPDRRRAEGPSDVAGAQAGAATGGERSADAPHDRGVPAPLAHVVLDAGTGTAVAALALEGPAGPRLLLGIGTLIAATDLRVGEIPLDALVAHVDPAAGFVLLDPRTPLPSGVHPLPASAWTGAVADAVLLAPDGTRAPAGALEAADSAGRIRLVRATPFGSAVVDRRGTALAYVDTASSALTLGAVVPWLGVPGHSSIADARRELRAKDPLRLLEDAEAKLAASDLDLASARSALEALLTAETIARDRAVFDRILQALPIAFAQVVVRELRQDAAAALARGRSALTRFGDDPDLLAVTAQAAAAAGEPASALDLVTRLRVTDPAKADVVLRSIANACLAWIERASAADRHDQAIAAAARLAGLAPTRADLAAAHAHALDDAGRIGEALTAARRAAALDAAHAPLVARLVEALEQSADPRVVRVPYDPASGAIRAEVRVGTRAIPMIVDTGATLTTIPTAVATELGLVTGDSRQVDVETANGRVRGTLVRLPSLRIGTLELRNVSAVALDLPGSLAGEGLLGLSALRRVDVQLDAAAGEIVFRRRERR